MRLPRRRRLAAGALFAACLIAGTVALAQARRYPVSTTPIAVEAVPIEAFDTRDPARTRFGALEFRGGLVLTSGNKNFGGISAIRVEADGARFIGVTDRGSWLAGRIVYRDGRPAGIADAEMAPILGPDGKPLAARGWYDAESLTELNGKLYVGIERVEKIVRFDVRRHGLRARGEPIPVPADFKSFPENKGLECLAASPPGAPHAGRLIAIAERSLDAAGNHRGFLLKGGDVVRFTVKRSEAFDISDCTVLPPRDLLLLERHFSFARGVAMRIRRVPLDVIEEGAVADGPALIQADLAYQIDNMEGMAVHRNARGETILTLVSDNNFSPIQRNLLLQFVLVP